MVAFVEVFHMFWWRCGVGVVHGRVGLLWFFIVDQFVHVDAFLTCASHQGFVHGPQNEVLLCSLSVVAVLLLGFVSSKSVFFVQGSFFLRKGWLHVVVGLVGIGGCDCCALSTYAVPFLLECCSWSVVSLWVSWWVYT